MKYPVKKVTEFGRKNAFNMGTQPFQVSLEMKPEGLISLRKARSLMLESALRPDGAIVLTAPKSPRSGFVARTRFQS